MSNADVVIAALRGVYDDLANRVSGLTDEQLAQPSAADEWDVSQVLSHLGGELLRREKPLLNTGDRLVHQAMMPWLSY